MGHKVNPIGMRLQVNRTWDSRWYADTKDYGNLLLEDLKIREFVKTECKQAGEVRGSKLTFLLAPYPLAYITFCTVASNGLLHILC